MLTPFNLSTPYESEGVYPDNSVPGEIRTPNIQWIPRSKRGVSAVPPRGQLEHPSSNDLETQLYKSRILPIKLWVLVVGRVGIEPTLYFRI